jgi:hypothetical protein
MVADHIVLPVESKSTYPYTLDGKHPSIGDALETFSILGLVAGATDRLPARYFPRRWRRRWMCCPAAGSR